MMRSAPSWCATGGCYYMENGLQYCSPLDRMSFGTSWQGMDEIVHNIHIHVHGNKVWISYLRYCSSALHLVDGYCIVSI
jgi:hypothetical protein